MRRLRNGLLIVEEILALTLGSLIAIAVVGTYFVFIEEQRQNPDVTTRVLSIGLLAIATALELTYPILAVVAVRETRPPFALATAMLQLRVPILLRPIVACYWLAHFGGALSVLWMFHRIDASTDLGRWALLNLGAIVFTYLAYGYLLWVVTAITKNRSVVGWLWERRVPCCLLICALSTLTHFVLPISISDGHDGPPETRPAGSVYTPSRSGIICWTRRTTAPSRRQTIGTRKSPMCVAVPGKIVEVKVSDDGTAAGPFAIVDFQGSRMEVGLAMTPHAKPGDWVLVHAGLAINTVDEAEARRTWECLRAIADGPDVPLDPPPADGGQSLA